MLVYTFDYESRAFTGVKALGINDLDPRSPGVVLVPGNATTFEPPRCGENVWPYWINGEWVPFEGIEVIPDAALKQCADLIAYLVWCQQVLERRRCRQAQQ